MRSRFGTLLAVVAALVLLVPSLALADNSWNDYHWPGDDLAPTVADRTGGGFLVDLAVVEWAGLGTPIQPQMTSGRRGDITVNAKPGNIGYLGKAQIWIEGGHITKGKVELNTIYSLTPIQWDHVLCQELGHVLGLDHNRIDVDTCMNDIASLGANDADSPNDHDKTELNAIYAHWADEAAGTPSGEEGTGGPNCGEKNKNAKKCRQGNGHWVTVDVFPAPSWLQPTPGPGS